MTARIFHTAAFRLATIYAAVFAAIFALMGVFVLTAATTAIRDQILQHSRSNLAAIHDAFEKEGLREAREVTEQLLAAEGTANFLILMEGDHKSAGNLPNSIRPIAGIREIPNPTGRGRNILGTGEMVGPDLFAFSGSDTAPVAAARATIIIRLLWLFAGGVLLAGIGGVVISRSFLARVDSIAATCRAIMAGNMKDRIVVRRNSDEMDGLAVTINAMLDRIDALVENVRQVSNDIAHDLRTPLTRLRQRLEEARAEEQDPAQLAQVLDRAIVSADEMLSLFAALLRISQIEAGTPGKTFATVEISGLLQKANDVFGVVAEYSGHVLLIDSAAQLFVRGDRELLFQMLANLIENSIVHTPPGTQITVQAAAEGDKIALTVRDDGPGIPPELSGKVFQRFYRLDASRSRPGHGLGLALVAAVVEYHGGSVSFHRTDESGLAVRVIMPQAPTVQA